MRSIKLISLSFCLLLGACAGPAGVWVKNGVSQLQVDQDNYACLQESQQTYGYSQGGYGWDGGFGGGWGGGWGGGVSGYTGQATNPQLYSACMKARGYNWYVEKTANQ